MREHKLIAFFVITFGISWGIPGILLLATYVGAAEVSISRHSALSFLFFWAPALSAFIVLGYTQGRAGLSAYLGRIFRGRYKWRWWTSVIIGIPLLKLLAYLLADDGLPFDVLQAALANGAFVSIALLALLESPISELGWRGFALPLLQRHMTGLFAALVLGLVWALWYVPWLLPGTMMNWSPGGDSIPSIVRFFAAAVGLSAIMTVVFNGSEGSILLMVVLRWLNNPPHPWDLGSHVAYVDAVITVTAAVILVFILRKRYLSSGRCYTEVTPGISGAAARDSGAAV